jgi:flagellar protein FlgJ
MAASLLSRVSSANTAAASKSSNSTDRPEDIRKAASEFESLLIGEILKSSREASGGGGWMGTGEDSDNGLGELAEQQLAESLAHNGGLGLAKMIETGMKKAVAKTGVAETTAQVPPAS